HLERAFINFFEGRARYPQFHKKHGKQSATFAFSAFQWEGQNIILAKTKEPLNIRWSRKLNGIPTSLTITKDAAGRYFVSLTIEEDITPLSEIDQQIGVDLGLLDAVILSTGEKV
ncbi:transposase, partial [Alicyclobacillaceae bacterium I2511]